MALNYGLNQKPAVQEANEKEKAAFLEIQLFRAAMKKDVNAFKKALQKALENHIATDNIYTSRITSMNGNSLIHVAAKYGNGEIVRAIAEHEELRFLLTKRNSDGDTVLHIAVKTKDKSPFDVLKDLHDECNAKYQQADVESGTTGWKDVLLMAKNNEGNTALHEALIHRRETMAKYLMYRVGRDVFFSTNKDGKSALYLSVEAGYFDCVQHMLANVPNNDATYEKLREGKSVIHAAVQENHIGIWDSLIECLPKRRQGRSVIHAEVQGNHIDILDLLIKRLPKLRQGRSVSHAEVQRNRIDILELLIERFPKLKYVKDDKKRSPLHVAASVGALEITRILLKSRNGFGVNQLDSDGMMPIHHAAMNDRVEVMKELLLHYHDPCELLTGEGERYPCVLVTGEAQLHRHHHYPCELVTKKGLNILHVAAKFGSYKAVKCILASPELEMLLNQMDDDGNTPLHLASKESHPRIVSALTRNKSVNVKAQNKKQQSALDVLNESASDHVFKQMLTKAALKAAGLSKSKQQSGKKVETAESYKDRVNNLLLVSTLVVTVTFAAGFTMPGAYNGSDAPDGPGMAINLKHLTFQVFVISNTLAMYGSMMVVVLLMWAQLGDYRIMRTSLRLALPLLAAALGMMCIAFMTGVYVTVSRLQWIAMLMLIFGCFFLAAVAGHFIFFSFPAESTLIRSQLLYYYYISIMLRFNRNLRESKPEM